MTQHVSLEHIIVSSATHNTSTRDDPEFISLGTRPQVEEVKHRNKGSDSLKGQSILVARSSEMSEKE